MTLPCEGHFVENSVGREEMKNRAKESAHLPGKGTGPLALSCCLPNLRLV